MAIVLSAPRLAEATSVRHRSACDGSGGGGAGGRPAEAGGPAPGTACSLGRAAMPASLRRALVVPGPQDGPGVDAGGVPVVPGEVEPPVPDLLGILDPQRRRRALAGPCVEALLAQAPALGAQAVDPELLEAEPGDPAVVPGDGDAALAFDVDGEGVMRLGVQGQLSVPSTWMSTLPRMALDTGQDSIAASSPSRKPASSTPGTSAVT